MKSLKELNLSGRRVLVLTDLSTCFHNALDNSVDDRCLRRALLTIKLILEKGGSPIVISHLGGPEETHEHRYSLKPLAAKLRDFLNCDVRFTADYVGAEVEGMTRELEPGQVLLLENLNYHPGERNNDPQFCRQLVRLADVFINDAFPVAHCKYASTLGIPRLFKEKALGLSVERELEFHEKALLAPKRPLCVVLGGLKVSKSSNLLVNLAQRADKFILGGVPGNTFLAAQGIQMGRSKFEQDCLPKILELLGVLARRECKVYLPVDLMTGPAANAKGLARVAPTQEFPADMMALDIGPASSILFKEALQSSGTIFWCGPMGVWENEEYAKGTTDLIENIAASHGVKVAAGGDTCAAIRQMQLEHKFDFISTGGSTFLMLLEGRNLPALDAMVMEE